jgi:hypothetical protein
MVYQIPQSRPLEKSSSRTKLLPIVHYSVDWNGSLTSSTTIELEGRPQTISSTGEISSYIIPVCRLLVRLLSHASSQPVNSKRHRYQRSYLPANTRTPRNPCSFPSTPTSSRSHPSHHLLRPAFGRTVGSDLAFAFASQLSESSSGGLPWPWRTIDIGYAASHATKS